MDGLFEAVDLFGRELELLRARRYGSVGALGGGVAVMPHEVIAWSRWAIRIYGEAIEVDEHGCSSECEHGIEAGIVEEAGVPICEVEAGLLRG
jgi:hypothetical protein